MYLIGIRSRNFFRAGLSTFFPLTYNSSSRRKAKNVGELSFTCGRSTMCLQKTFDSWSANWTTAGNKNNDDDDKVLRQLTNASGIDNVLVLASTVHSLTAPQLTAAVVSLDRLAYDHMCTYPWAMYDNRSLLCIQTFINSESQEYFQLIVKCPEFEMLLNESLRQCSSFSNADLVNVLLSLLRLHVDQHCPSVVALLQECQRRWHTFDLEALNVYSELAGYLKRSGFHISANIANCLMQDQTWSTLLDAHTFANICRLFYNVGYFMTKDSMWQSQATIKMLLHDLRDVIQPHNILEILEPVVRFSSRVRTDLLETCVAQLDSQLDSLTTWQLHRSMLFLREVDRPFARTFREKVCDRGLEVLASDNLRAVDVVHLLSVFDVCYFPKDSRSLLENLLEVYMDDLDALLLKNVSGSQILNQGNHRLSEKFCHCVRTKLHDIGDSVSCLLSIVHCLSKMRNRPAEVDAVLSDYVHHQITNCQLGSQPGHICTVGRYLVQCFGKRNEQAAALFTEKLISILPNTTILDMVNVALGLSVARNGARRHSRLHTDYILSRLTREILRRRQEISSLALLNLITNSILLGISNSLREGLTLDLVELYDRLTEDETLLSADTVKTTVNMLRRLRLRVPGVLERLTTSLLQLPSDSLRVSDVSQLSYTLSKLNYRPSQMDALAAAATQVTLRDLQRASPDFFGILRLTTSLASLDVLPDELLFAVFNINFLDKLEDSCSVGSATNTVDVAFRKRKSMERFLVELNRCVVLQCPHPGINWFCEAYCEKPRNLDAPIVGKWKNFIYDGLTAAVGGSGFLRSGPLLASYGLAYDFECRLDRQGRLVSCNQENDVIRVAIVLLTPSDFSTNSRHLCVTIENKIVQLEMLGFKVVQVPYFELESMLLSDSESKKHYFKEKIFKANNSR